MHGGVPTYDYYQRWSLIAPAVFLALILLFAIISIVAVLPLKHFFSGHQDNILIQGFHDTLRRSLSFFLFEFDSKQEQTTTQEERLDGGESGQTKAGTKIVPTYYLYGVKVKKFFIGNLFAVFLVLVMTSIVTFMNTFLTENSFSCEENFDCFVMIDEDVFKNERITDCSNFTHMEIICFRMAYKYSEGLGEAGGFLFVMQVIVNFLTWLSVRLGSKGGQHCRKCTVVAFSVVMSLSYVFVVAFLPFLAALERPKVYETLKTPQRQLQLFIYAYSNLFLAIIPILGAYNSYPNNKASKKILEVESEYSYSEQKICRDNPLFRDEIY